MLPQVRALKKYEKSFNKINNRTFRRSKKEIEKEVLRILETFKDENFIFNLGHGILPETPIENVELVVDLVKNHKLS